MIKISEKIVKNKILILIISLLLLIPSVIGFVTTRINYDILSYLPKDLDTMKGQDILIDEFGKGGFGMYIVKGMEDKDISNLKTKIENVKGVESVIWYDDIMDTSVPKEILPDNIYKEFNNKENNETLMAIFFKGSMGSDETMKAVEEIRSISDKQCFLSGMSSVITDIKEVVNQETVVYVIIAAILTSIILAVSMDSFMIPVFFLLSIGMSILYNLGSNFFLGDVSFITKALTAVLQLAVTMDYSIFLYHSYQEELENFDTKNEAMANAITNTFTSIVGSSITTIAGFLALCFMTFTLGLNLGIVMAKGVVIGIISCVTILPSFILTFEKTINKTKHRNFMPNFDKLCNFIVKNYKIFALLFVIILIPSIYGYKNTKVYYNLADTLPAETESIVANNALVKDFDIGTTHMILADKNLSRKDTYNMINKIKDVKGIKDVLSLDSIVDPSVPDEMIPSDVKELLESDKYKLIIINSSYKTASTEVNNQITSINNITSEYDKNSLVIGEAACTKDLIDITDRDFKVVSYISIIAILIIIAFVFKSISLPIILVSIIEFAIFINMGLPFYTNTTIPFIASVVIGTIQLGATVDYAILMTTRYKRERTNGLSKKESVTIALKTSINSIIVSALGFFLSTLGVSVYSKVDMISSLCTLLSRGAIISMFTVIFMLPSALMIFDKLIIKTSYKFNIGNKGEVLNEK
ncbi:MMPL family transporter [uncultured Anaerofustis sp.]|uniref:efflux RND transporter permease subunit n=1 Tax=uncultured Anaerofustis sp. TaxID=904996 RepID=UPI0025FD5824|nr:MMPL family transporter [uncultured Anaerofustis sp.]